MPKKLTPFRSQPCQDCSKPFDVYHRFQVRCEPCQTVYRNTRKKEYNLVCQSCSKAFRARSHRSKKCPECAATTTCKTCGNEFEKTNYQHRDYCSERCSNLYKAELYFGGNYLATLERDGYQCCKCGSKQSPHVHHIDLSGRFKKSDRERCNNDMSNLITLCNSCHQALHQEIEYQLVQRHLDETIEITNKFIGV
jgi:hypothetical protein